MPNSRDEYRRALEAQRRRLRAKIRVPEGWRLVAEGATREGDRRFVDGPEGEWLDVGESHSELLAAPGAGVPVKKFTAVIRRGE